MKYNYLKIEVTKISARNAYFIVPIIVPTKLKSIRFLEFFFLKTNITDVNLALVSVPHNVII